VRVVRQSFTAGFTFRDEELIKSAEDIYCLVYSPVSELDVALERREKHLSPGEATLLHDGCAPAVVGAARGFRVTAVLLPGQVMRSAMEDIDGVLTRPIPQHSEGLRLLKAYLHLLDRKCFARLGPEAAGTISRHIVDLGVLSVTEAKQGVPDSRLSSLRAVRLKLALAFIGAHYHEPDLSIAAVAQHLGISSRCLELLLETTGQTYTQRILELRLQRVYKLLSDRANNPLSVSHIALSAGFSDLTYFFKRFRQRFGETPTAVRAHTGGHGQRA
jgi:AraC-like DNA-binding protein